MDAHLTVLLHHAQRWREDQADDEEIYVWWGKVRSPNRQQRYPHVNDVRAIGQACVSGDVEEVHLYLTDYRSLYVGDVCAIVEGDLSVSERDHVPAYYAREGLNCDFWFRLGDVRRLVTDDTLAVVAELRQLRNVHYEGRPVSLYGGMVDLPLIVERPDGRRLFDEDERERLTDGGLWAELDARTGSGVGATARMLREDRFGVTLWDALEPSARLFVASAEHTWGEHRRDPAFDFGPVITGFGKALEVQCNATLQRALTGVPPSARLANIGGRTEDLLRFRALSLGELAHVIGGERALNDALATRLQNGRWFAEQLPAILAEFARVRNAGAHTTRVDRETAQRWRDRLIGVGCLGDLLELALAQIKPVTTRGASI